MSNNKNRNITTRTILRSIFSKGNLPREEDFEKLIDSTFNKADDRMDITDKDGLMLFPTGNNDELISLYKDKDDQTKGKWAIKVSEAEGLSIVESPANENDPELNHPALQIGYKGNIGIGIENPRESLDVNGLIVSKGRVGSYRQGKKPADGKWHNVFDSHRDGINAYEIVASSKSKIDKGRFGLIHAIALSTYGNSHPKIRKTSACYGKKWNRLDLRWECRKDILKDPSSEKFWMRWWNPFYNRKRRVGLLYNLQIRTRSNYGDNAFIYYRISKLWDDHIEPDIVSQQEEI